MPTCLFNFDLQYDFNAVYSYISVRLQLTSYAPLKSIHGVWPYAFIETN
jgi:hypothetical protein